MEKHPILIGSVKYKKLNRIKASFILFSWGSLNPSITELFYL